MMSWSMPKKTLAAPTARTSASSSARTSKPASNKRGTRLMEAIEAARAFVQDHFPESLAAFLGGSVVRDQATPTSDLDIVIITTREDAPYRQSLLAHGWPIEVFVHSHLSYQDYFASDAARRRPTLAT